MSSFGLLRATLRAWGRNMGWVVVCLVVMTVPLRALVGLLTQTFGPPDPAKWLIVVAWTLNALAPALWVLAVAFLALRLCRTAPWPPSGGSEVPAASSRWRWGALLMLGLAVSAVRSLAWEVAGPLLDRLSRANATEIGTAAGPLGELAVQLVSGILALAAFSALLDACLLVAPVVAVVEGLGPGRSLARGWSIVRPTFRPTAGALFQLHLVRGCLLAGLPVILASETLLKLISTGYYSWLLTGLGALATSPALVMGSVLYLRHREGGDPSASNRPASAPAAAAADA